MRTTLALLAALVLAGCDLGGGDTLRLTYEVNATGAHGPVSLTYDTADGPITLDDAPMPFDEAIQINDPRTGSVYLVNAETTCTGPCTLSTAVEGALGNTPYSAEDEVVYPADTTRTIASSASIIYR